MPEEFKVGYVKCSTGGCNMQWWPREGWPAAKTWYCDGCTIASLKAKLAVAVADVARATHAFENHYRVGQMEDGSGWYVSARRSHSCGWGDDKHLHPTWQAAIDAAIADGADKDSTDE